MNMHIRNDLFNTVANINVGLTSILRMNTALQAHLCRTTLIGLTGTPHDLFRGQVIRPTAQVLAHFALRKRTELTFKITDIRIVNIAIDHVSHLITGNLFTQLISSLTDVSKIVATGLKQTHNFCLLKFIAGNRLINDALQIRTRRHFGQT